MTRFRVEGTIRGEPAVLEWEDGEWRGDPLALARINWILTVERDSLLDVTPTGPAVHPASEPAWVARLTAGHAFDGYPAPLRITGDEIDLPYEPGPPGTIY